jgi:transcriptional regulator with XRE-family HTH domain
VADRVRPTIGVRLRELRGHQTQIELATAAGLSVELVRALEQGRRHTASITSLQRLARALNVDVGELLSPCPRTGPESGGELGVLAIRHALTAVDDFLDEIDTDGEPLEPTEVERTLTYAWGLYWSGYYERLARVLPDALARSRAVHRQALAADRDRAAQLAAGIHQVAACTLVHLHEPDAAHLALRQAIELADTASDLLLAATLRGSLSWLLLTQGRYQEAYQLAAATATRLECTNSPTPNELSVRGSLLLGAATAAGRAGQIGAARNHLVLADEAAGRLGHDRNDYETAFGPSQVVMQTVDVYVVTDEYDDALTVARSMPRGPGLPPAAQARHLTDVGLAHEQLGQWAPATDALLAAERTAPAWIKHQTLPKQIVRDMLARQPRPPLRLRELAARLGVS